MFSYKYHAPIFHVAILSYTYKIGILSKSLLSKINLKIINS